MLSFLAGGFALAGLIAAAGPIAIHLLNRRRFRVVPWGAMDFLREALRRSRRVLQLRDLVLLALRVLCVLLFGLALARPYSSHVRDADAWLYAAAALGIVAALAAGLWAAVTSRSGARKIALAVALVVGLVSAWGLYRLTTRPADGAASAGIREPIHAILIVDNSLSMGYTSLHASLLDQARSLAARFVDELPRGSRVSVLPLCGPPSAYSTEPYRTREDALDALQAIRLVDRQGSLEAAAGLAQEALAKAPELAVKRIVLVSDQQRRHWSAAAIESLRKLPELQVVQVAPPEEVENTFVAGLSLRDGLADVETDATLVATVQHLGPAPRSGVQVALEVDGVQVASKVVDLQPDQALDVEFQHKFDVPTEPGRPAASLVRVFIPADRLPEDNERALVVPVLSSVPVVFVDQYGAKDEDPSKGRYGETFQLRRLLAPVTSRVNPERQLVRVRHTTIDNLLRSAPQVVGGDEPDARPTRGQPAIVVPGPAPLPPADEPAALDDARLVVVAGVARPDETAVQLLREYVLQGGQLLIAAGGEFDPAAWNETAWRDGAGILPLPLAPAAVGQTPAESSGALAPFFLDFKSASENALFKLEGEHAEALADLFGAPLFFKAVAADAAPETRKQLAEKEQARIQADDDFLRDFFQRRQNGPRSPAQEAADLKRLQELRPQWLLWGQEAQQRSLLETADRQDRLQATNGARPPAPSAPGSSDVPAENRAAVPSSPDALLPRVHARFTNGLPFLVERRIGQGRVMLVSTGVFASPDATGWNTLPLTDAMLLFDRVLRLMLESTLPQTNFATVDAVTISTAPALRLSRFALQRPGRPDEPLAVETLGSDRYGVVVRDPTERGHYVVTARRSEGAQFEGLDAPIWQQALAVNGPAEESDLRALDAAQFTKLFAAADPALAAKVRWVGPGEPIRIEGAQARGQNVWWKVLIACVVACLILEMSVLGWQGRRGSLPRPA
ncbi:MAG: BatA domain-containing protein [Planctomycetia bacterium]|nr:BatA domain-containing protein [Planctomycetia bacterium]